MKRRSTTPWHIAGLALLLVSCGKEKTEAPAAQEAAPDAGAAQVAGTDSAGGAMGMSGGMDMRGMSGTQMGMQMMGSMKDMEGVAGNSMVAMMPMHQQALQTMMAQMDRERQDKKLPADPKWTALTDSIKADMAQMSQMSADQMHAMVAAHHGRVTRLIEMHRAMMQGAETPK